MPLQVKFTGIKEFKAKLDKLRRGQAKVIWRKGVRAATTVITKAIRPLVSTESKTLKKSIGQRVKDRKRDKQTVGIAGARQKFTKDFKGKIRKPSKYSHLVENGRKARMRFSLKRGPYIVRGVKGRSFIGKALKIANRAAFKAMADKFKEELKYF